MSICKYSDNQTNIYSNPTSQNQFITAFEKNLGNNKKLFTRVFSCFCFCKWSSANKPSLIRLILSQSKTKTKKNLQSIYNQSTINRQDKNQNQNLNTTNIKSKSKPKSIDNRQDQTKVYQQVPLKKKKTLNFKL